MPLEGLEERLAHTTINDTYLGPPQLLAIREDSMPHVTFNQSSLSFLPPGVNFVTEIWSVLTAENTQSLQVTINGMGVEGLRQCLYAHGLNQLGSEDVLRKRLVQFVSRLGPLRIGGFSPEMPQSMGEHGSGAFPMTKLKQPKVLTPDTFYDYLLIIDLEATCEEGWHYNFPHEIIEFPRFYLIDAEGNVWLFSTHFVGQFKGLRFQPFADA